jgi:hypothetical protein
MKFNQFVLFVIGGVLGSRSHSTSWKIGQPVNTTSGLVIGGAASSGSQVSGYFGIPYAKPPVGDLRFASPEKFEGSGTINATSFVSTIELALTPANSDPGCRLPHQ